VLVGEIGGGVREGERERGLGEVVVRGEGGGEPVFKVRICFVLCGLVLV
jgi:hypothetical protein